MLQYGLANQAGITVITGEIGCGKTTLIRHLLDQMDRDITVGLITNTHSSFGDLLQWVLLAFDLEYRDMEQVERYQVFIDFLVSEYAQNRHTVLIVDEAQNMDAATIEELRMLSNVNADKHQVLQLVLVGQPELRVTLRRHDLRQFAQRVSVDYHLEPLDEKDTREYVRHRINSVGGEPSIFQSDACELIYKYSKGIPRIINILCDTALVYAFAAKKKRVSGKIINEVASDKSRYGMFEMPAESETEVSTQPEQSERLSSVLEIQSAKASPIDRGGNEKTKELHDKETGEKSGQQEKSRCPANQATLISKSIDTKSDHDPHTRDLEKSASFDAEDRVDAEITIPSLEDEPDRNAGPSKLKNDSAHEITVPSSPRNTIQDAKKALAEAEETLSELHKQNLQDLATLDSDSAPEVTLPTIAEQADNEATIVALGNNNKQDITLPTFTEKTDQEAALSTLRSKDAKEVTALAAQSDAATVAPTLTYPPWLQDPVESQGVPTEQQTPEAVKEQPESKNVSENSPPKLGILRWLRPAK
ncbi:MAG: AAA family ATPase [Gammaproteobacteria bacterium]|nr:AAA family ATPase [Gammaproteobacteria bacterium]